MPKFTILDQEWFDEEKNEFVAPVLAEVNMEHSLVSLSKWESKWELPFFGDKEKTPEQVLDYMHMMCLDPVDPSIFEQMNQRSASEISKYIESKQTATWITESKEGKSSSEKITSELIYYWMVTLQIPFECQYWHINRLLTLVKVCNAKNQPEKKMSRKEIAERNRELNKQRREQMKSSG